MNNSFSWARVRLLIRRYLNENSRQLWMAVGVVFGVMFLLALLFNSLDMNDSAFGVVIWLTLFFIGGLAVEVSASLTFSSMSTKPRRIVAMMVPASKAEKFVSLMLIYNIFDPIAILLSALAADAFSAGLHLRAPYFFDMFKMMVGIFPQIDFSELSGHWGQVIEAIALIVLGLASMFFFNQSVYTLGSALWPKKSFIKTFCALYVIQMVLSIFLSIGLLGHDWILDMLSRINFGDVSWHLVIWGTMIVWYAIIIAIFWSAWRRYKSTQLVQKFMMN